MFGNSNAEWIRTQERTEGWGDFHFLRFSKMGTLLSIGYIFMSSIPKNRRISPRARAAHDRQSFIFFLITGTLKMNIFLNLQ